MTDKKTELTLLKKLLAEKEKACANDPESSACKRSKLQLTNIIEKLRIKRAEKELNNEEEQERIKAEKAEKKAAIKAEKEKLKVERKKACLDDPESKACKEGKASGKIKNVLKKIKKTVGG